MQSPTASVAAPRGVAGVLDPDLLDEARRQFDICNSCRYCEGICAVFPALELRQRFSEGDALFLANLCHDCRECFDACPYATPHEFRVDLPPLFSEVRQQTYRAFTRPQRVGAALLSRSRSRSWAAFAVTAAVVLVGGLMIGWDDLSSTPGGTGAFYDLVPFGVMTVVAFTLSGLAIASLLVGLIRFWRTTTGVPADVKSLAAGLSSSFTLRNLSGGGPGCPYPDETPRTSRRLLHSLVYYGFLATFLATVLAAVWQEILGEVPPYPVFSVPVITGIAGGISTISGAIGLTILRRSSRTELATADARALDRDFVALLVLVNLTGFAVLVLRTTAALGLILLLHLGLVAAFFATLPFGKFVHATYRTAALVQDAAERRGDGLT